MHISRRAWLKGAAAAGAALAGGRPLTALAQGASGKQLVIDMTDRNEPTTIIGVVGDTKFVDLRGQTEAHSYWPHPQLPYSAMTLTVRYVDREMRDGWLASGMTEGLGRGYERLDDALEGIT